MCVEKMHDFEKWENLKRQNVVIAWATVIFIMGLLALLVSWVLG